MVRVRRIRIRSWLIRRLWCEVMVGNCGQLILVIVVRRSLNVRRFRVLFGRVRLLITLVMWALACCRIRCLNLLLGNC